jgi:hypothetical protein
LAGFPTTGSNYMDNSGSAPNISIVLTDDSKIVPAAATPGGPRHNIISGALGVPHDSTKHYGWFYPEMGIMVFSGYELSSSIPGQITYGEHIAGQGTGVNISASIGLNTYSGSAVHGLTFTEGEHLRLQSGSGPNEFSQIVRVMAPPDGIGASTTGFTGSNAWRGLDDTGSLNIYRANKTEDVIPKFSQAVATNRYSSSGFAPNLTDTGNAYNALRFVNCMANFEGTTLRLRSEEDQTQENYFCRIKATEYNFSANPTFTSGSKNKIRNLDMHGNPQTFITGCGLYNSAGQLLAIAKLSAPLKKNFASEATIKVKLTY